MNDKITASVDGIHGTVDAKVTEVASPLAPITPTVTLFVEAGTGEAWTCAAVDLEPADARALAAQLLAAAEGVERAR